MLYNIFKTLNNMELLPSIRIIEIKGADIYYSALKKEPLIIKNSKDEFDEHFSEILPPNLDLMYLQSQGDLNIKPLGEEFYSYDLINVSFQDSLYVDKKLKKYDAKEARKLKIKPIKVSAIRKELYLEGFVLNNKKYVRYKRSSGAAKSGNCVFIRKDLYGKMNKWSKTGLDENKDLCLENLTSYEAYRALSLSSLVAILNIHPRNILFVEDVEVIVKDQDVVAVSHDKKQGLVAKEEKRDVTNNIFDGEGLLDASVFRKHKKVNNGMMLLRSRFFKCCAFNTRLKQWFKDNHITDINQLNGITCAKSVDDILLVASSSCLKYLKMCKGGFNRENIERWCNEIAKDEVKFGVVKYDKPTRFFDGEMVETTYQLLNTLQLNSSGVNDLISPYIDYIIKIRDIRRTPEFIRFFLEGEDDDKEHIEYEDDTEDTNDEEIAKQILKYSPYSFKNKICLELTRIDGRIKHTGLFKKRVFNSIIDSLLLKLYNGRVLVNGTYATLFGNPYEFLQYIIKGKDGKPLFDKDNPTSLLNDGEIYCSFFEDDAEFVASRSPHVCSGNILISKNKRLLQVDHYFNLTHQIAVVDSINSNIQQRLSGCDYDSDAILITDNQILLDAAKKNYNVFKVPYIDFSSTTKKMRQLSKDKKENVLLNLYTIDSEISNNVVGKIVNLSQLLNSHLWDRLNSNKRYRFAELYSKICILCVLSGADIDSSKRSFPFKTALEYSKLRKYAEANKLYEKEPLFFTILEKNEKHKPKISKIKKNKDKTREFKTTMDYLWDIVNNSRFLDNVRTDTIPFFDLINVDYNTANIPGDYYRQVKLVIEELDKINKKILELEEAKKNDFELKKLNFNSVVKRSFKSLKNKLNNVEKAKLTIKTLEDLDDGYSKIFLLLYIISNFSKDIGYSLKDLFYKDAVPLPTLRRTKYGEEPQYILFKRHEFVRKDR